MQVDAQKISRRGIEHRESLGAQPRGHAVARPFEPRPHRVEPGIAFVEPERDRRLQIGRGREGQELVRPRHRPGEFGRRDHPPDFPSGKRKDLAGRADLDRPLRHPRQ